MKLKFQRLPNGAGLSLPSYKTDGAAGMDIVSADYAKLMHGDTRIIRTGFAVEVPEGYEIQIRSRSGLAAKHGVFVTNGVGTIDSDYRGELMVILSSLGSILTINRGDRIAQLVLMPVTRAEPVEAEELSVTVRSGGGLGSTGR